MSINTVVRASGSPAATQRSQKPDTMSVSEVPARPACVSHADNSAKKASFMPRLYSRKVPAGTERVYRGAVSAFGAAGSSDRCNTGIKSLGWGFEAQSLIWPFI